MPHTDTKFEIQKMLTLSTAHVTPETARLVQDEPDANRMGLCVYEKSGSGENYGWFICLDAQSMAGTDAIPRDLMDCIGLARRLDCEVLCLDRDGPEVPDVPVYDWDCVT